MAYRQKQSLKADEPAMMPGSKNPNRLQVFPSSKNIDAVVRPGDTSQSGGDFPPSLEPPQDRDLVEPSGPAINRNNIDAILNENRIERPRTELLPSSKIGGILRPEDVPLGREEIDEVIKARNETQEEE